MTCRRPRKVSSVIDEVVHDHQGRRSRSAAQVITITGHEHRIIDNECRRSSPQVFA
jgi:hypothetical protein